jgi:membrane-associated protein
MAPPCITSDCEPRVTIETFLIEHGGALILPAAVVEGPIVAVVTGFLAARGFFDWYWVLCLLVCGDVIGDLIYYWIGRSGGTRLARVSRYFGLRDAISPELQRDLKLNAGKMWFVGKWTHSIGWLVLVGSGMLRLPLPRFIVINFIATVPKCALLLGLGYFAGDNYPFIEDHAAAMTIALCIAGVTAIAAILRRTGRLGADRGTP